MDTHPIISCAELQRLYVAEGLGVASIARLYGASPATISNWLRRCGIAARQGRFVAHVIPAERIYQLYVVERLPLRQIATLLGVSIGTINNRRRAYGIPPRGRGRSH